MLRSQEKVKKFFVRVKARSKGLQYFLQHPFDFVERCLTMLTTGVGEQFQHIINI